jgi:hypothetical protein
MQNTANGKPLVPLKHGDNIGKPSLRMRIKNVTKKTINYMKKVYVSPLATEVNVEATNMLAASLQLNSGKTVDTSADGAQLSGGHRGQWGNLWN